MSAVKSSATEPVSGSVLNKASKKVSKNGARRPFLGYGLGLRPEYYDVILEESPNVDWFEIISENYMVDGGKALYYLDSIRANYPIVMHGVSLSIGSTDPLDKNYLKQLKVLADRIEPKWISDHLCWTGQGGHNLHDLLPLPYNEDTIKHVVQRVKQVQDYLGRQILLENLSSYVTFRHSQMAEWEFLSAIVEQADCLILLDINNIYVSSVNHEFDPHDYLYNLPGERIRQFHLAGHEDHGDYIIDTHDHPVVDPVWKLYADALAHFGPVSAMIERDDKFPPFQELMQELQMVRDIGEKALMQAKFSTSPVVNNTL